MNQAPQSTETAALLNVLSDAVRGCGRSRRAIALTAGMNKDTMKRVLCGSREITLGESLRILAATGAPAETTLLLALFAGEDVVLAWKDSEVVTFLGEMFRKMPQALAGQLGERIGELRPRWGAGAAVLVARMLSDHMDELARRDDSFGEVKASQTLGGR